MPAYPVPLQRQAAAELAALPPADPLRLLVHDYGVMRQAVRAAQTPRGKP